MSRWLWFPCFTAALFAFAPSSSAQSLGDIARKEAERRGTAPAAPKTYTNGNLTPDFTTPAAPETPVVVKEDAPRPEGDMTAEEAAKAQERDAVENWGVTPRDQQEPAPADDFKEDFWRNRSALIKARLASQNAQVEQLRLRMAATRGASDGERDVLERTFAKAEVDLKHLNNEWLRFERQARERGVPENWWR